MQWNQSRGWRIGRPAILFALAACAPLAVYAAIDGYAALRREQAQMAYESVAGARALAEGIDRGLAADIDSAESLADAPALDKGLPTPVWMEVARRRRLRHDTWLRVMLVAPDGRWLFTTDGAPGSALPMAADMASLKAAVERRRPVIGDAVRGPLGRWGVAVRAPVVRDGRVLSVVTVVLDPKGFSRTIAALRLPKPWVALVIDAYGNLVTRSHDPDQAVGQRASPQALAARARGGEGVYMGRNLVGTPSHVAYWMSPVTGWSVHVAVPKEIYEAPLRKVLATIAAGFFGCLGLALALVALWLRDFEGRRNQAAAVEQATRIDALGRLTGGVAHDFNNLLTVIQGNAELLARRLQGQPQAERPVASIRIAADRAAKLTRQLLVFARGGPAEATPIDLAQTLEDLVGPMSQLVGEGVSIKSEIEPGLPPVSVDPLQLEAALLNLAANARDAMRGSGLLELRLRRQGPWIALSARDHGPGFEPAILSRVFDPFFTTKPVGQGTGLGLSQVYGLVKGAGGKVEAANAPGGGAVVTLLLPPMAQPLPADPSEAAACPRGDPASMRTGPAAVLLVDDNEAVRATTAAFLRECGLSVIEAGDAAQALRALEAVTVEVVASDIIMPGDMDGIALAQTIRSRWPGLPVLLVSGYSERVAEAQARGLAVVGKPYSLPDLERRLRGMAARAEVQA